MGGVDQTVVAQRHVERGGVTRDDERHLEWLVHRHHRHRHLGLEGGLQHQLVVVLHLGWHHRPGVGHRLAVQERLFDNQAPRRDMHGGANAFMRRRTHLQGVDTLGHAGEVDHPARVGGGDGHHVIGVRVQQLHLGTGQVGLVGGKVGVLVGHRHLHIAGAGRDRAELEWHGHVAAAAHHIERAVVALQGQVGPRRQQQRNGGLLARRQIGDGGRRRQAEPVHARRQLHLQRPGGRATGVDNLKGDGLLRAAQHAAGQVARVGHQLRHQRVDRERQVGGDADALGRADDDGGTPVERANVGGRRQRVADGQRAAAVQCGRVAEGERDAGRQAGQRSGHGVQGDGAQVVHGDRARDRLARNQRRADAGVDPHAQDVETVLWRTVGHAGVHRIDRVVASLGGQGRELGFEVAVTVGQRRDRAGDAIRVHQHIHQHRAQRQIGVGAERGAGHLDRRASLAGDGVSLHRGVVRRRDGKPDCAQVVALIQLGHAVGGVGEQKGPQIAHTVTQLQSDAAVHALLRGQRPGVGIGADELVVGRQGAVGGQVQQVLPVAVGIAQAGVQRGP